MIKIILCALFLTEMVATGLVYRLRRNIFSNYPKNYESIGYRDSDGAYLDAGRTVFSIPFAMSTSGLPQRIRSQILLLRIHRSVLFLIAVPIFIYVSS